MKPECDVVIAGGGMAGLVAAVQAAESDASVTVLEKGHRPGGTMYISGGIVWTVDSVAEAQSRVPKGDPMLHELVVTRLPSALDWLRNHGIDLKEPSSTLPGPGKELDPSTATTTLVNTIEDLGGRVLLESPLDDVVTSSDGQVAEAWYRSNGTRTRIATEHVVLATGGFQGNERLVQQYITDAAENLLLRSNPWSTGDGLTIARSHGAQLTTGLGSFYGHSLPAPPAEFTATEFRDLTQFYGPWSIVLNEAGERFTDESTSELEELLIQEIVTRANARAWYVFDSELYHATISTDKHVQEHVDRAAAAGGHVSTQPTIGALCDDLDSWGVNGTAAAETIAEYNDAITTDRALDLDPSRQTHHLPLDEPPFFAVEIRPGITFTMGGIKVNSSMEILNQYSSTTSLTYHDETPTDHRSEPISGLYAAGVDIGNFSHDRYLGGLAFALVTGRIAGETAARNATTTKTRKNEN